MPVSADTSALSDELSSTRGLVGELSCELDQAQDELLQKTDDLQRAAEYGKILISELAELQQEADRRQDGWDAAAAELQQIRARLGRLDSEAEAIRSGSHKDAEAVGRLQGKLQQTARSERKMAGVAEDLEHDLDAARADFASAQQQLATLREQLQRAKSEAEERESAQRELEALQEEFEALKTYVAAKDSSVAAGSREQHTMIAELGSTQETLVATADQRIEALRAQHARELEQLSGYLASTREQLRSTQAQLEDAERDRTRLAAEANDSILSETTSSAVLNQELAADLQASQDRNALLSSEIGTLTITVKGLRDRVSSEAAAAAATEEQCRGLRQRLAEAEAEAERLKRAEASAGVELEQLRVRSSQLDSASAAVATVEAGRAKLTAALARSDEQARRATAEAADAQAQNAALQAKLDAAGARLLESQETHARRLAELEPERRRWEVACAQATGSADAAELELEQATANVAALQGRVAELESEADHAQLTHAEQRQRWDSRETELQHKCAELSRKVESQRLEGIELREAAARANKLVATVQRLEEQEKARAGAERDDATKLRRAERHSLALAADLKRSRSEARELKLKLVEQQARAATAETAAAAVRAEDAQVRAPALMAAKEEAARLQTEHDSCMRRLGAIEDELAQTRRRLADSDRSKGILSGRLSEVKKLHAQTSRRLADLQQDHARNSQTEDELRAELSRVVEESQALFQGLEVAHDKLAAVEGGSAGHSGAAQGPEVAAGAVARVHDLSVQNEILAAERDTLAQQLLEFDSAAADLEDSVRSFDMPADELRVQLEKTQAELHSTQERLRQTEAQFRMSGDFTTPLSHALGQGPGHGPGPAAAAAGPASTNHELEQSAADNLGIVMVKQLVAAAEAEAFEESDLVLRAATHIASVGHASPSGSPHTHRSLGSSQLRPDG